MVKRISVILLIILGVFISFSLYRTYAYNTTVVEDTPTTTDLEYTFKIGNSSIKEITINSGETKYYDVVMGNPNNAKISYSIYYEMVSPNTKPDNFSIEYTSKSTGDSTGKVDKNGNITLNLVVTNTSSSSVTVKLGSLAGYVNGGELLLSSGQEVIPKLTASKFIMSLDDGSTGDSGSGVYKIEHDAIPAENSATGSEIPAVTDYRYYGASPNNYICLDNTSGTCEDRHLYRIIGSIYEENAGQNILKVIKATPITDGTTDVFSWDNKGNEIYSNVWSTTTSGISSGSTIMQLLNGIWLTRGSGSYYYGTTAITVNFTNYGPSDKVQSLINTSRYYLGGCSVLSKVNTIYGDERGTARYDTSSSLYWDGNIGLMYASDYGYAAGNECVTNTAINQYNSSCNKNIWINSIATISAYPTSVTKIVLIQTGKLIMYKSAITNISVFPTFYLSKDVVITSGTGSLEDPYQVTK